MSKGNLLKHLQNGYWWELDAHKSEREKLVKAQDEHVVSRANFAATDQDCVNINRNQSVWVWWPANWGSGVEVVLPIHG